MGDDVTMEVVVESAGFGGNMIGLPVKYHGIGTFFGQILLTYFYLLIALISSYAVNPEGAGT